jgi:hypothetical protein
MLVTRSSGGLSVMPTSWRQAAMLAIAIIRATSPSHPTHRRIEEARMYRATTAGRRGKDAPSPPSLAA